MQVELMGVPDANDPEFAGKNVELADPPRPASDAEAHATRALRRVCGNVTSILPAVAHTRSYKGARWYREVLCMGSNSGPVSLADTNFRVVTHSWLGLGQDPQQANRRTDAMIDRDGILQVYAAPNAPELSAVANSYNTIIVGRVVDASSVGPTFLDTKGRCKPDILAPLHTTSQATPCVASTVVLLAESAILQAKPDGAKPYVIKSLLMTGAQKLPKNETRKISRDWHPGSALSANDHTMPLDLRQGAGMVRIDRSYAILQRPEAKAGEFAEYTGWTRDRITAGKTNLYLFACDQPKEFAATLVWHRHIPGFGPTDAPVVNNLDLYLYQYAANTVGALVDCSISKIDNVEHIYLPSLPAGTYALAVVGTDVQGTEDYGLSWTSLLVDREARKGNDKPPAP
jgi:hypothetical protein